MALKEMCLIAYKVERGTETKLVQLSTNILLSSSSPKGQKELVSCAFALGNRTKKFKIVWNKYKVLKNLSNTKSQFFEHSNTNGPGETQNHDLAKVVAKIAISGPGLYLKFTTAF